VPFHLQEHPEQKREERKECDRLTKECLAQTLLTNDFVRPIYQDILFGAAFINPSIKQCGFLVLWLLSLKHKKHPAL